MFRLFLITLLFITFTVTSSAQNIAVLPKQEVEKSIKDYLSLLFGGQPTLKDYYNYHGRHDVSEKNMENELSEYLTGSPTSDLTNKIIEYRNSNPDKVPSIYFRKLKKYYPLEVDTIKINNIELNKRKNNRFFYTITVTGYSYPERKNIEYKFYHNAYSTSSYEEGVIEILEIDGNNIENILLLN